MDYRKEIAEMINRIRSEKVLRYIWIFVSDICKDIGIKTNEQQNHSIELYIDLCYNIYRIKKGGRGMSKQEMEAKIEKELEEFEQEQWRKFEEEDLAEEYEKFTEKFADNPDIEQQEVDDQWKEEKEELEADFKYNLNNLLEEEKERLIEYYSDELE